jgi:hypothetical protein
MAIRPLLKNGTPDMESRIMSRIIDADILREEWLNNGQNEHIYDTNDFLSSIDDQPTVDATPIRHGHWVKKRAIHGGIRQYTGTDEFGNEHTITVDERMEYDDLYCSECNGRSSDSWLDYCPKCGAKMDGGEMNVPDN